MMPATFAKWIIFIWQLKLGNVGKRAGDWWVYHQYRWVYSSSSFPQEDQHFVAFHVATD